MQRQIRSLDGKPIAASINGFSEYTTSRKGVPQNPAPVVTAGDLRLQLQELRRLFANDAIDRAINLLFQHLSADNPHGTDLTDFTSEIIDLLYAAYKENGGEGSRDYYVRCLYQPLRVASLAEMQDPKNQDLLISIRGFNRFLQVHEKDPEAHRELMTNLLPGQLVTDDPTFALYASYGVPYDIVEFDDNINEEMIDVEGTSQSPFSFVGPDGHVHYARSFTDLPVTYRSGRPEIPCFGETVNLIRESTNFGLCQAGNVSVLANAEEAPDGSLTATSVCAGDDTADTRHTLTLEGVELPPGGVRTFSVFAKAESCRYMAIHWKDLPTSDVVVQAIFDLQEGVSLCINHMDRYRCDIQKLSGGYYRCEFTMFHPFGRNSDLEMVFFKEKQGEPYYDFTGRNEVCCTVWGMQLEASPMASPYIPTAGKYGLRRPLRLVVPLDDEMWTPEVMTLALTTTTPRRFGLSTIFSLTDMDRSPILTCDFTRDSDGIGLLNAEGWVPFYFVQPEHGRYTHLTYSQNREDALLASRGSKAAGGTHWQLDNAKYLYLGCSPTGSFLQGYLSATVMYSAFVTAEQAIFLNEGDHG